MKNGRAVTRLKCCNGPCYQAIVVRLDEQVVICKRLAYQPLSGGFRKYIGQKAIFARNLHIEQVFQAGDDEPAYF